MATKNKSKKRPPRRRCYLAALKVRAVKLHLEEGYPTPMVAAGLGIGQSALGHWVKRYREEGESGREPRIRGKGRPQVDPAAKAKAGHGICAVRGLAGTRRRDESWCVVNARVPLRRSFRWWLPGWVAAGLVWSAYAGAPTVPELVAEFDGVNYRDTVSDKLFARKGMNRAVGVGAENPLCRAFIHAELQRYGLDAYQDVFSYVDTEGITREAGNVIAVKEGVQNPEDEMYVIGSHFDSEDNPGADDNATGVAALLEMARIFSQYHFARTIVFCAFDGEEVDDYFGVRRLGSSRYADRHGGDNIKGMVSVDMVGWQASGASANQAWIYGRPVVMDPIRRDVQDAVVAYGGGLVPVLRGGEGEYSDHVAFADAGFQACLFIEGSFSSNPHYHQSTDYVERANYLDWDYAANMCRSVIGYFATMLEPVDVTPTAVSIWPGTNAAAHVIFAGLPGCQYAVQHASGLGALSWTDIQTNTASLADGTLQVDIPAGAGPRGYYRARFVSGY